MILDLDEKTCPSTFICSDTQTFKPVDSTNRIYRKEIIYTGRFAKAKRDNGKWSAEDEFEVSEDDIKHWETTGRELLASGIEIPYPIEHKDGEEAVKSNLGYWVNFEAALNPKGKLALFGYTKFKDAEAERIGLGANVSILSPASWMDSQKKTWRRPIRHICATVKPLIPGLSGFQTIAASMLDSIPEKKMNDIYKALLKKFGIQFDDSWTDAKALEAIDKYEAELKAKAEKTPATKENPVVPESGKQAEGEQKIAASQISFMKPFVKKARTESIKALVSAGNITPATGGKLVELHTSDEVLAASIASDPEDKGFEATISALKLNQAVKLKQERTGAQTDLVLSGAELDGKNKGNPAQSSLVKRCQARREAFEKSRK